VWANQGAMLMISPSFPTTSRSLLESYGVRLTTVVIFIHPRSMIAYFFTFPSENRIELAELGWSKSRVNNPFLSMVIRR